MWDQTPNYVLVLKAKLIRLISLRTTAKGPKRWPMAKRALFSLTLRQSKKMASMTESKPSPPCKHSQTGACHARPMDSQQTSRLVQIQAITVWVQLNLTLITSWLSNRHLSTSKTMVDEHQLKITQTLDSWITTKSTIRIVHRHSERKNHWELEERINQRKQM